MNNDAYLIISDLQIPFEENGALDFCNEMRKHWQIPLANVLCAGDEIDQYFGSMYNKNPDMRYSPTGEIEAAKKKLRQWYKAFPEMKLAISNHGMRWAKKASQAEIPSQMIKAYQEVLDAPDLWRWQYEWRFNQLEYPFRLIHGMGYSGVNGHRNAALDGQISTAIGHLHSFAGISFINTLGGKQIWGMNTGSLIDTEALAFEYGKESRNRPILGVGGVFQSGFTPAFQPFKGSK